MRIGRRLHVRFTAGRRWHTQSKWPDGGWRVDYFETDDDWGITPAGVDHLLEWKQQLDSGVVVEHRVVSCYQIKFTICYRSFWFEASNHTKWKPKVDLAPNGLPWGDVAWDDVS